MTTIELPGGDRLVLHGLSAADGDRGAIERVSAGRRIWVAFPPKSEGQDAFVAMRLETGSVIADSFQGMSLRLDPATGAVLGRSFSK